MSGNIEQASMLYEKVLSYEPTHKAALINLAKINYRFGKYKISQSYIERALKQGLPQTQSDDLNELLKKLSSKMTIIIISHKKSNLIISDRIFFLNKGILEGNDSFKNLINNNDNFKKLFED